MSQASMRRPQRQFSTLGAVALIAGILLLHLYLTKPELQNSTNIFSQLIYFGTGLILTAVGSWLVISELFPTGRQWGLGRFGRYRVKMPPEALLYVIILLSLLAGALFGRSNMLLLVFSLLCGPFVLNGSMTLSMLRGASITRGLPTSAVAGDLFSVTLTVSNSKRWISSWMMTAVDTIRGGDDILMPAVLFPRVPARSSRIGAYRVRLMRRGVYEFGPLEIGSQFPLGLMERSVVFGQFAELTVYPRLGRLTPAWYALAKRHRDAERPSRPSLGAFDDEFHRLREYRSGDNPKAIHWRTSARRNELMVREFHQERESDLVVVVDLWQPDRPARRDLDRVELAVGFAATICTDACSGASGFNLTLGLAGLGKRRWSGVANGASVDDLLTQLAVVKAGVSSGLKDLCRDVARETRPDSRRLLITTRHPLGASWGGLRLAADAWESEVRGAPVEIMLVDEEDLAMFIEFDPPAAPKELMEANGVREEWPA